MYGDRIVFWAGLKPAPTFPGRREIITHWDP